MKNIVCIGDSHTWGQGAGKLSKIINVPPVNAGEHRQISFELPSYVNLLRNYIQSKTGSKYGEIMKDKADNINIIGKPCNTPYISINDGKILAMVKGSMVRLQTKCGVQGTNAYIWSDKKPLGEICTYNEEEDANNYKIWKFCGLTDTAHELMIESCGEGRFDLYRIDYYGGEYAVINSGVGSCNTEQYLKNYWNSYVDRYQPYLVIIGGFSINDWICNTPLDRYIDNLNYMFKHVRMRGGKCIFLTESPIVGNQKYYLNGPEYRDYIEASIRAAYHADVPVADAFKAISNNMSEDTPEEDIKSRLFEDNWHVNKEGHRIYFECLREQLKKTLFY